MGDMKQQLEALYELQQADTGIVARKKALRELDDGSNSAAELAAAQEQLASLKEQHQSLDGTTLDKELRLKGAEEERDQKSKQAYGGTIADPKQLSALEKKIAELGRFKDKLEEEILELMEEAEQSEQAVETQQAVVADLEKRTAALRQRHATETQRLTRELEELYQKRQELAAQLDDQLLKQYEGLLDKTGGLAVAAVHEGACQGCKVGLPSTYAPRLQAGNEIVRCENCRRILYLPGGESPFRPEEDK